MTPENIDHSTALEIMYSSEKLIIFCGSGISLFAPTNLPTGADLRNACIESISEQFQNAGFLDPGIIDLSKLPLEFLLGLVLEDLSDPLVSPTIHKIANYFCDVVPNRLHYLLASFLANKPNCFLIATNYDISLEKALGMTEPKYNKPSDTRFIECYGMKRFADDVSLDNNSIFKIHGCARLDNPEQLVLVTQQESAGLPSSFLNKLPELFEGSLVAFFGYSASEPDCLEALLSISNYDVLWISRSRESFINNSRARTIIDAARRAYLVLDLAPFISNVKMDQLPEWIVNGFANPLNDESLLDHSPQIDCEKIDLGKELYRSLIIAPSKERLLEAVIRGFLHLRDFDHVYSLLPLYDCLKYRLKYNYLYWEGCLIRDKNADWERARELFFEASILSSNSVLQTTTAKAELLALDSLIGNNEISDLKVVEKQIRLLIEMVEKELISTSVSEESRWYWTLGAAQKALIQNLSYQVNWDSFILQQAFTICEDAIRNLLKCREINLRLEVERFLARLHLRAFYLTGETKHLDASLEITRKVYLLFSLMEIDMGVVNAGRQYTLLLILNKRFDSASQEIRRLKRLLKFSPDNLSKIKVVALEHLLILRQKGFLPALPLYIKFLTLSVCFSESGSLIQNIHRSIKWYKGLSTGFTG